MGLDMNNVNVGNCCKFRKVTCEEKLSRKQTGGSGKEAGKFIEQSSIASKDLLSVVLCREARNASII